MTDDTTIKLSKDFKEWLSRQGKKGDSYQDIIMKIVQDLSPEKMEEYLKKGGYDYERTAREWFGLKLKGDKKK